MYWSLDGSCYRTRFAFCLHFLLLQKSTFFKDFKKSNFYQPKNLVNQEIKTIGLVAGFDDFQADICLAEIGLY